MISKLNKKWGLLAIGIASIAVVSRISYGCGSRSKEQQVSELAAQLAQNEKTAEIERGLYATKIVEVKDLKSLLEKEGSEIKSLQNQLRRSKSELLTTQQLAVKWKSAYEGALEAQQTDSGPSPITPGLIRKRVDFKGDFGPIAVSGHTLTDPPEGFVSVRQARPLTLTVNVARDRNGKWSSLVTSSEPTISADVRLGGVDLSVLPKPSWHQKLWVDLGSTFLGETSVSLGISYRGDRFSLGLSCFESFSSHGCGLVGGVRIFR